MGDSEKKSAKGGPHLASTALVDHSRGPGTSDPAIIVQKIPPTPSEFGGLSRLILHMGLHLEAGISLHLQACNSRLYSCICTQAESEIEARCILQDKNCN